jgi:hypothetical protein
MSPRHTIVEQENAEDAPLAVLQEAQRARAALDGALQEIMRILDLLLESDGAEQQYRILCDEHQRALTKAELPPDLRAVLERRRQQRVELRAMFVAYHAAERRWRAARRQVDRLICRTDE